MQIKLTDFGKKRKIAIRKALKLAKEKYKNDWAIQTWLRIYKNGTNPIIIKNSKGKKKVEGIAKQSKFARDNLIRAIELREEGKVMNYGKKERKKEVNGEFSN